MPSIDYRQFAFDVGRITRSGHRVGRSVYWKLYTIENIFRCVIHTVLSSQINAGWWSTAVDNDIRTKAQRFKKNYLRRPWYGKPGIHDIYYIGLGDLNEIMRANSNLFRPVVPDLDRWVVGIESLRLPRNIVAHMNFPSSIDRKRIDVFYEDCLTLIPVVQNKLPVIIP